MLAHMKTHRTEKSIDQDIVCVIHKGVTYYIPVLILQHYAQKQSGNIEKNISGTEVLAVLDATHTRAGALLKGIRCRENMTQVEFARKINVTQANLSAMENGKRPIGKDVSKRIARLFDVDYRYFLE